MDLLKDKAYSFVMLPRLAARRFLGSSGVNEWGQALIEF